MPYSVLPWIGLTPLGPQQDWTGSVESQTIRPPVLEEVVPEHSRPGLRSHPGPHTGEDSAPTLLHLGEIKHPGGNAVPDEEIFVREINHL